MKLWKMEKRTPSEWLIVVRNFFKLLESLDNYADYPDQINFEPTRDHNAFEHQMSTHLQCFSGDKTNKKYCSCRLLIFCTTILARISKTGRKTTHLFGEEMTEEMADANSDLNKLYDEHTECMKLK